MFQARFLNTQNVFYCFFYAFWKYFNIEKTTQLKNVLRKFLLIEICFLISAGVSTADDFQLIPPKQSFEILPEVAYYQYRDPSRKEDGLMYGIVGNYNFHSSKKLLFSTRIEYITGKLDFYRKPEDGNSALITDTRNHILEGGALVGYDFVFHEKFLITPFMGVGYRYFSDDISGNAGIKKERKFWYFPVGIKMSYPLSNKISLGLSAEYDLLLAGKEKAYLSDFDPALNDPESEMFFGSGFGLRFSPYLKMKLTEKLLLSIKPFLRYWDIGRTSYNVITWNGEPVGASFDPAHSSIVFGLRLGFELLK